MNDKCFCEWDLKPWIILLVLFAAGVLAFSFWSALDTGRVRMDGYHMSLGNPGGGRGLGPMAGPQTGPGFAVPPSQMAMPAPTTTPAGQLVALVTPSPQHSQWQGGAPTYPNYVDTVTMPTPMGGIKFINRTQTVVQPVGSPTDFNRAVDMIRPCVVEISATRSAPPPVHVGNLNGPRFLDPFDGVPEKFIGRMAFESVGSGVIVDPAGYVVTNHHVVAGADTIVITRFQHREGHYSAQVVAADPSKDLSLLRILGEGPFPSATLADSSRVQVGDWVITVGNPFGLGHTVTAGIISGKRDSLVINGVNFKGLLQTDAPINKGSSGGPLVNMAGQVVGINCAIYAPTGVFNGTGFAIPSNRVGAFVARYIENDNFRVAVQRVATQPIAVQQPANHGASWLGIGAIDMSADLASKLSYPHAGGIYVISLTLDSPADEAEITRGDIITAVSGRPIQDSQSLRDVLARVTPGQSLDVTIWRGGKTESLKLRTRVGGIKGV